MKDLYCKKCKEVRMESNGNGSSITVDGNNDLEFLRKFMKCSKCGSELVTKEKLEE